MRPLWKKTATTAANTPIRGKATVSQRRRQTPRGSPAATRHKTEKRLEPIVSPIHQVAQLTRKLAPGTTPASHNNVVLQVALVRQLRGPAITMNRHTSPTAMSAGGQPTRLRINVAPSSAWNAAPRAMLPAMTREVTIAEKLEPSKLNPRFAQKDPSHTPGQQRAPSTSNPLRAMPDGGQTAVA